MSIIHSNLVPCEICGEVPTMVADEHGYSVLHPCVNMSTRGVLNQQTAEQAAAEWKSMNHAERMAEIADVNECHRAAFR